VPAVRSRERACELTDEHSARANAGDERQRGGLVSPLRWDVLVCGLVLATPVLMLGLRGDLTADQVATRLVWCLAAGWAAVAVVRFASTPRQPAPRRDPGPAARVEPDDGDPATP
jgi:hypothetical protein